MAHRDLIQKIEAHAVERGIAPATVTSRAVGNSRLYDRLRRGGSCTIRVADRICAYIQLNTPSASDGVVK